MTLKKVYYFTEKVFREKGWSGYYELVCTRMLENDNRIDKYFKEYKTKGFVCDINYSYYKPKTYDLDFEKQQLTHFSRNTYERISKITIKELE